MILLGISVTTYNSMAMYVTHICVIYTTTLLEMWLKKIHNTNI